MTTTHTLLEELRALGIQLSTDGMTITVDAPKGVMTPALWTQISERKQELITLLRSEDESLYTFARVVSRMVDVLGGPGSVRITEHKPGLTLSQYARQIRPLYEPVTLPALPRSVCPFRVVKISHKKDGDHQIAGTCQGIPLPHGWCREHALSHTLLELGAVLAYPSLSFGGREIGEGVVQWESYAERISRVHLERDIASIRAR